MRKPLHIMAVGAHILDAEITCGMTLAKHSMQGDKITTVALTAGEGGHPEGMDIEDFRKMNIEGATKFAETLGGKFICMNYTDSGVPETEEIYDAFADLVRREKPDIILTHWSESYHEDHALTSKIVRIGVRRAAFVPSKTLPAHFVRSILYAENWEDEKGFIPYIYVDVTDSFELWREAVKNIYAATRSTYFDYLGYYDALSLTRGYRAAITNKECKRAECFALSEMDRFGMRQVKSDLSFDD